MTDFWAPTEEEADALVAQHPKEAKKNPQIADNYLFHSLFNVKHGVYAKGKQPANLWYREKGVLRRKKTRFSRREWIERYFKIRNTDEEIVPLILNQPQRKLEATILKMQRAGFPVRVIILKARKLGFTTYIEAVMAHEALRRENFQALIISDTADRAELTLSITNTGLSNIKKSEDGAPWKFKMASDAAYFMQWETPIHSSIVISSAKQQAAGRGGTPSAVHGNETAYWENPERTAAGALASLPERPHTMGFSESTANSDTGWFPQQFWAAWKLRDIPLDQRGLGLSWVALFFPYYEHPDAFWTKTHGQTTLPDEVAQEIATSLTDEEAQVLQQTYHRRWSKDDEWTTRDGEEGPVPCRVGVGQRRVNFDQLAWWRKKLNGPECNGDINIAHREYPWCVTGETRVSTELGIVPIRDAADAKLTESGAISRWFVRASSPVFAVTTKRGRILRGTADHMLAVLPHGEPGLVWTAITDLQPRQALALCPPRFSEKRYVHEWSEVPCFTHRVEIDEDWGLFLGFFMGDGCWTRDVVEFACDAKDQDVVEEVARVTRALLGAEPARRTKSQVQGRTGCTNLRLARAAAKPAFVQLGLLRRNGDDKWRRNVCVPECIWRSPIAVVRQFLRGLFESDGCTSKGWVTFSSCKDEFVRDVQLLLLGFGINSTISHTSKPNGQGNPYLCHTLGLGIAGSRRFHDLIGFVGARKSALRPVDGQAPGSRNDMEDEVVSVAPDGVEPTYDFTIPESGQFSSNGILSHNCPEVAFWSSGNPVFSQEIISEMLENCREPVWRGDIVGTEHTDAA